MRLFLWLSDRTSPVIAFLIIMSIYVVVIGAVVIYCKWARKKYKGRKGVPFYSKQYLFENGMAILDENIYRRLKEVQRKKAPISKIEQKYIDEIEKYDDIFALQRRAENFVAQKLIEIFNRDQWEYLDELQTTKVYKEPGQPEIYVNPEVIMNGKVKLDPEIQYQLDKIAADEEFRMKMEEIAEEVRVYSYIMSGGGRRDYW